MAIASLASTSPAGIEIQWFTDHGKQRHAETIPWDAVTAIDAFKRDVFSYDLICLQVATTNGRLIEFDEEDPRWEELMAALPRHLPGCRPWGEWFAEVAFPAFAQNIRRLYERKIET